MELFRVVFMILLQQKENFVFHKNIPPFSDLTDSCLLRQLFFISDMIILHITLQIYIIYII